ncbi:MAG: RidA family protein, partial [Bacteroidota bacterium]
SAPVKEEVKRTAVNEKIIRMDRKGSSILKGVSVPAGYSYFFTSGQVGSVQDTTVEVGDPARYGDTYTQSIGALEKIEGVLEEAGLTMKDVVFLRVFIAPDPSMDNKIDFDAWFKAYGEYFNNAENSNKVARTTLGIASLVVPGMLVEVEAVAAYISN